MKAVAVMLIVLGLVIGSYPLVDRVYTRYLESQLIDDWEVSLTLDDISPDTADNFDQLQLTFEEGLSETVEGLFENEEDKLAESKVDELNGNKEKELSESIDANKAVERGIPASNQAKKSSSGLSAIGRLEIPKIEANIPILESASSTNLKVGAGHITGTAKLGSVGNAALAAHRSHTYGRMFNRLDELEVGDTIRVTTSEGIYEYIVYKTLVVNPDDISVLYQSNEERILTLITCTPLYTATHRLIVHAVILK